MSALSLGEAYQRLAQRFRAAGLAAPELDARLLLLEAARLDHAGLIARPDVRLQPKQEAALEAMATERLARRPVSRILGRREFYGRDFHLSPDTLDPRPDSETLIDYVLGWAKETGRGEAPLRLVDLGTGSGILVATLLAELPKAAGIGSDMSSGALEQARMNADMVGVGGRARWLEGDWCSGIDGAFDVIVSNPPYIATDALDGLEPEVRMGDPLLALDGGHDGLAAYRAIAGGVVGLLAADGLAAFEVGAGQHEAVRQIFGAAGLRPHPFNGGAARDLAGRVRVVGFTPLVRPC